MKVLYVVSGNKKTISPIFYNQYQSIKPLLKSSDIFMVVGRGLLGYLKNILLLRKKIKDYNPDLVHAHYSMCGCVAAHAGAKRLIVSLMGSDTEKIYLNIINKLYSKILWNHVIVKNNNQMNKMGNFKKISLIPNGVDINHFKTIPKSCVQKKVGYDPFNKNIIFIANPNRKVKNVKLAKEAVNNIKNQKVILNIVYDIPHHEVNYYLQAADVLLFTSIYEGSPNIIKEAMAANCPIVSTDVGDVRWVLGKTKGCYIASYDAYDIAEKINMALEYSEKYGRTNGRERILNLGLDSDSVAKRIKDLYVKVIQNSK